MFPAKTGSKCNELQFVARASIKLFSSARSSKFQVTLCAFVVLDGVIFRNIALLCFDTRRESILRSSCWKVWCKKCGNRMWWFSDRRFGELSWVYKTNKLRSVNSKCHLTYTFIFKKITSPQWPLWHAVQSCFCDRKLRIIWQQIFISGCNFDPDVHFRLLTSHKTMWGCSELNCKQFTPVSGQVLCLGTIVVNFRALLREGICISWQGDHLRDVIFKT